MQHDGKVCSRNISLPFSKYYEKNIFIKKIRVFDIKNIGKIINISFDFFAREKFNWKKVHIPKFTQNTEKMY